MKKLYTKPELEMLALRPEERLASNCYPVNSGVKLGQSQGCENSPNYTNSFCTYYQLVLSIDSGS